MVHNEAEMAVIKIDATSDTNNESRDLLTFTSRAPTGQYFICLQVFMPDARPSTFCWVFQVVLPDLFGHDVMHRIQMLMTDGDRACTNCEPGRAQNVNQNACAQNVNQKKATKLCVL